MTTVRSDTPPFVPTPVVRLDVPAGWEPLVLPDALVAVAETEQQGPFRANVVVTVRRVATTADGGAALSLAVEQNTAALEAAERWAELGSEYRTVLGLDGYRVEGAFVMPGVGTVFQALQLATIDHGAVADVIALTATCGADEGERLVPVLRAVLESARLH